MTALGKGINKVFLYISVASPRGALNLLVVSHHLGAADTSKSGLAR
jgi:hypothetical protein